MRSRRIHPVEYARYASFVLAIAVSTSARPQDQTIVDDLGFALVHGEFETVRRTVIEWIDEARERIDVRIPRIAAGGITDAFAAARERDVVVTVIVDTVRGDDVIVIEDLQRRGVNVLIDGRQTRTERPVIIIDFDQRLLRIKGLLRPVTNDGVWHSAWADDHELCVLAARRDFESLFAHGHFPGGKPPFPIQDLDRETSDFRRKETLLALREHEVDREIHSAVEAMMSRLTELVERPREAAEVLATLSKTLGQTGLTSTVTIEPSAGAPIVRYRRAESSEVQTLKRWRDGSELTLPIGYYYFWTENDGRRTCGRDALRRVVLEHEREIEIEEDLR